MVSAAEAARRATSEAAQPLRAARAALDDAALDAGAGEGGPPARPVARARACARAAVRLASDLLRGLETENDNDNDTGADPAATRTTADALVVALTEARSAASAAAGALPPSGRGADGRPLPAARALETALLAIPRALALAQEAAGALAVTAGPDTAAASVTGRAAAEPLDADPPSPAPRAEPRAPAVAQASRDPSFDLAQGGGSTADDDAMGRSGDAAAVADLVERLVRALTAADAALRNATGGTQPTPCPALSDVARRLGRACAAAAARPGDADAAEAVRSLVGESAVAAAEVDAASRRAGFSGGQDPGVDDATYDAIARAARACDAALGLRQEAADAATCMLASLRPVLHRSGPSRPLPLDGSFAASVLRSPGGYGTRPAPAPGSPGPVLAATGAPSHGADPADPADAAERLARRLAEAGAALAAAGAADPACAAETVGGVDACAEGRRLASAAAAAAEVARAAEAVDSSRFADSHAALDGARRDHVQAWSDLWDCVTEAEVTSRAARALSSAAGGPGVAECDAAARSCGEALWLARTLAPAGLELDGLGAAAARHWRLAVEARLDDLTAATDGGTAAAARRAANRADAVVATAASAGHPVDAATADRLADLKARARNFGESGGGLVALPLDSTGGWAAALGLVPRPDAEDGGASERRRSGIVLALLLLFFIVGLPSMAHPCGPMAAMRDLLATLGVRTGGSGCSRADGRCGAGTSGGGDRLAGAGGWFASPIWGTQGVAPPCAGVCDAAAHGCDPRASCRVVGQSITCECPDGWDGDGRACSLKQCDENNGGCHPRAVCHPQGDQIPPKCFCGPGFKGDGYNNCVDIDECGSATLHSDCHRNAHCINEIGSYRCECDPGFEGDGRVCWPVDECARGKHNCHHAAQCVDTLGADAYRCICGPGWRPGPAGYPWAVGIAAAQQRHGAVSVGFAGSAAQKGVGDRFIDGIDWDVAGRGPGGCLDIDECSEGTHDCAVGASCTNTPGSYRCGCPPGFKPDPQNEDKCLDIDECEDGHARACGPHAVCMNLVGSHSCSCEPGFEDQGDGTCVDIDECVRGTHDCRPGAPCHNTPGSWECGCPPGFEKCDPATDLTCAADGCRDVDECARGDAVVCGPHAVCSNKIGDFSCACLPGYRMNSDGVCVDIDECAEGLARCQPGAPCTNTPGSYACGCPPGFEKCDSDDEPGCSAGCRDVDECASGPAAACGPHADCLNEVGGHVCSCQEGFRMGRDGVCVDIDECEERTHRCDLAASCSNTIGSYDCVCPAGLAGDGFTCLDVDECAPDARPVRGGCHEHADCHNTHQGHNCVCRDGWRGDGYSCVDIDECLENTHSCSVNARCSNTPGSYKCDCNAGYGGDGFECRDDDECALGTAGCGPRAICRNDPGGASCHCPEVPPHHGDPYDKKVGCVETTACSFDNGGCGRRAICSVDPIDKEAVCTCKKGFIETDDGKCVRPPMWPIVWWIIFNTVGLALIAQYIYNLGDPVEPPVPPRPPTPIPTPEPTPPPTPKEPTPPPTPTPEPPTPEPSETSSEERERRKKGKLLLVDNANPMGRPTAGMTYEQRKALHDAKKGQSRIGAGVRRPDRLVAADMARKDAGIPSSPGARGGARSTVGGGAGARSTVGGGAGGRSTVGGGAAGSPSRRIPGASASMRTPPPPPPPKGLKKLFSKK